MYVDEVAAQSLKKQNIRYQQFLTVATPFNTVLWRVVAMDQDGYWEGFYSLLDDSQKVEMTRYTRRFESVEIYNLLAAVLGLEPAPNDGERGKLDHLLAR